MTKIRVGLLFGGRSGEHEVSLASAASVLAALDRHRYEAVPIGITRDGHWQLADSPELFLQCESQRAIPSTSPNNGNGGSALAPAGAPRGIDLHQTAIDVVFPLLHGPYGEDGTVQGLLELADIPYVGSGVLGSALSMDKAMMKTVFAQAGLPVGPWALVRSAEWERTPDRIVAQLERELAYPMFVKPCNLGSSVGISKAHDRQELIESLNVAMRYDRRVIVEEGIDACEVECGVLGNDDPVVSVPGEIVPHREYYDYEAKYIDGLADLIIPARLTEEQATEVRDLACQAFQAVDAAGLARVDFFVRHADGKVLVNEINTMPGFTATSMYPRLWEATGLSFPELVDRLIELAQERHGQISGRCVTR